MKHKITFIINNLKGGGAEKVCITLANGLVKRGFDIDLVVLGLKGSVREAELSKDVKLINLEVHNTRKSVFALKKYIKQEKPTTILSFNRQISIVLGLVRTIFKFKFKLISRNIIFLSVAESHKKGLWHGVVSSFLVKKFYSLSDCIIAQSIDMGKDLQDYLKMDDSKIVVINNPINREIEKFVNMKNEFKIEKKNYFLCVGRLENQKAFHYAINAFYVVLKKYPLLKLKIVGSGSLEDELKNLVKKLGIERNIDFEGFQSEMIPYYLFANATILTSLFEGFPNVLTESIALGTPVVSFDCPSGPNEIVQDGLNGYLVKYKDTNHLISCMELALNNEWDYTKLIHSVDCYSSNKILNEYEKLLLS
ncbi:MAG: glycosyltransferase [Campylobacterota bacterium]|nr:glycosyltransferase [Campylobacterota bacterium]